MVNILHSFHKFNGNINTRKEDIKGKNPGALMPDDPKLIWVSIVKCPSRSTNKEIFSLVTKGNDVKKTTVEKDVNSYYLEITSVNHRYYFDSTGYLNEDGIEKFWRELNSLIHDFDNGLIELLPMDDNQPTYNESTGSQRNSSHSGYRQ